MASNLVKKEWEPSLLQDHVVMAILHDGLTITQACKDADISTQAYYLWFKKKDFVAWYDTLRALHIKSNLTEIDKASLAVGSKADSRSTAERRLIYERVGELGNADKQVQATQIVVNVYGINDKDKPIEAISEPTQV